MELEPSIKHICEGVKKNLSDELNSINTTNKSIKCIIFDKLLYFIVPYFILLHIIIL